MRAILIISRVLDTRWIGDDASNIKENAGTWFPNPNVRFRLSQQQRAFASCKATGGLFKIATELL